MNLEQFRRLEINGGRVEEELGGLRLRLPPVAQGYGDAQVDNYGRFPTRRLYPWFPGVTLHLRARFSHPAGRLQGTAGFGFWNAPFGDPTIRWPALPQAAWFFYASAPADLPLAATGPGRDWFVSTLDATTWRAWGMAPFAPVVLLLNQFARLRQQLWPFVRRQLGISYAPLAVEMTNWHNYELTWQTAGTIFRVDGNVILSTPFSPRGPLGLVCWLDNQYLVVTPQGRFGAGTLPTSETQWLEIRDLQCYSENRNGTRMTQI